MRDPYSVLGLSKSATDAEIKAAYRRLAKKYHPDRNAGDVKAKERFAELGAAYEILGDKNKRRRFDRGEMDASGDPRYAGAGYSERSGFGSDFGGFSFGFGGDRGGSSFRTWRSEGPGGVDDILREFMGGVGGDARERVRTGPWSSATERGADIEVSVSLQLEDLAGDGKVRVTLPTGKTVDIQVPPGAESGQQVRLRGQGAPSPTGSLNGDAIVTLEIAAHPLFRRDGTDLRLELPVTLHDAVLGAKVRCPTLDGSVNITVPEWTSSGRTLRLKGKGLPTKSGGRGDLLVTLRIALPDQPDPELSALMQKWRREKPYDPA